MNHDKPIFSKSQAGAEMFAAPDPTMRTRTRDFIQNYLTNILGQNTARQYAENIAGADPNNPMPRNPLGIGAADFTPLGLLFAGQEIKRDFDKASRPLDYVAPTIGGVLSAAEAYPLTKIMVKGIAKPIVNSASGFLSSINKKALADEANLTIPEKPEVLMTSPGPKTVRDDETNVKPPKGVSRRTVLQGLAAAPVAAGALSNIPAGKIVDDIVKEGAVKVSKKVPISSFKNMLTNSVQMRRAVLKDEINKGGSPDMEEIIEREFDSIDELNDDEVNDLYEYIAGRATPYPDDHPFMVESRKLGIQPDLRATEDDIKREVDNLLEEYDLSAESFVEGTEPTGDLLDLFVDEMKKSGYENKEIADFINDSLDAAKFESGKNFGIIE
tara:strand:- start:648 stop:1802 length:1155 start_codon:yes stop_codon:yes gene_type:complete